MTENLTTTMVYRHGGQERQLVTACCLNWRCRAKLKQSAPIKIWCRLTVKCSEIANCGNTQNVTGKRKKTVQPWQWWLKNGDFATWQLSGLLTGQFFNNLTQTNEPTLKADPNVFKIFAHAHFNFFLTSRSFSTFGFCQHAAKSCKTNRTFFY